MLTDKDEDLRVEVVVVLRCAGKAGVPALIAALKDKSVEVRLNAADALGRLVRDAQDAVPALTEAVKDADEIGTHRRRDGVDADTEEVNYRAAEDTVKRQNPKANA